MLLKPCPKSSTCMLMYQNQLFKLHLLPLDLGVKIVIPPRFPASVPEQIGTPSDGILHRSTWPGFVVYYVNTEVIHNLSHIKDFLPKRLTKKNSHLESESNLASGLKRGTLQIFTPSKLRGLEIAGSLQFLQPFIIDSVGFPCTDPAIPSSLSFDGVKICSVARAPLLCGQI